MEPLSAPTSRCSGHIVSKNREILITAEQVLQLYGDDWDQARMPPHCILIKDLLEISRDFPRGITREEVGLMIRYDGVVTTHPNDNQLVLSITIECYTISLAREESNNFQLRGKFDTVSTIVDDTGMLVVNDRKITSGARGHFGRHSDESSRAYKRRDKDVARQYFDQVRRVALHGGRECQDTVFASAVASGFLQEGSDTIRREIQFGALKEDEFLFWPARPEDKNEHYANIRSIQEIIVDPWFREEMGRPSVAALLRKVTVGGYVIIPERAQIKPEDIDDINSKAANDRRWF
jgi:hypothetical protein